MKPTERLLPFLLAALMLTLWTLALGSADALGLTAVGVSAKWQDGVSPSQLVRAERRIAEDGGETANITLCDTLSSAKLTVGEVEVEAELTRVYGDAEAVEPSGFVAGAHPPRGDAAVSLSSALAEKLFGSSDIVGAELSIDGTPYTVRGVFDCPDLRALVMLSDDSSDTLTRALILTDDGVERAETLLNIYGLPAAELCDLSLVAWTARAIAGLPAALLLVFTLGGLLKRGLRLRFYPLLLLGYLPLAVLAAVGLYFAAGGVSMPARLIPSRYSDFEFWGRVFSRSTGALFGELASSPDRRALGRIAALCSSALFGISAAAVAPVWLRRTTDSPDRLAVCAAVGAGALAALTLAGLAADRAMIFLPTACAAVRTVLREREVTDRETPQVKV